MKIEYAVAIAAIVIVFCGVCWSKNQSGGVSYPQPQGGNFAGQTWGPNTLSEGGNFSGIFYGYQ